MGAGAGSFAKVFDRLTLELNRLKRIEGINENEVEDIKDKLLTMKSLYIKHTELLLPNKMPTTPYAIAVNRLDGYNKGEFTWEYFMKAWEECNVEDQTRLNELIQEGLDK